MQRGFAPSGAPRPFAMEQFAGELGSAPCGQRPLPASPIKVGRNIPFLAHGALGKKELPYPSHLYLIPNKATFLVPFHPSYPSCSCYENSPVLFAVPGGRLCLSGCCRDGQQNPPKFSRHPEGWQEMGRADSEPKHPHPWLSSAHPIPTWCSWHVWEGHLPPGRGETPNKGPGGGCGHPFPCKAPLRHPPPTAGGGQEGDTALSPTSRPRHLRRARVPLRDPSPPPVTATR